SCFGPARNLLSFTVLPRCDILSLERRRTVGREAEGVPAGLAGRGLERIQVPPAGPGAAGSRRRIGKLTIRRANERESRNGGEPVRRETGSKGNRFEGEPVRRRAREKGKWCDVRHRRDEIGRAHV